MKALKLSLLFLMSFTPAFLSMEAGAQSIFLEPNTGHALHLEALHPSRGGFDYSSTSLSMYLSGRFQADERMDMVVELPFATYSVSYSYPDYWGGGTRYGESSGSSFGNPYIGLDFGAERDGFRTEFGLRLPLVGDGAEAANFGFRADRVERAEAHIDDTLPIYLGMNYRYLPGNGFGLRVRVTPVLWAYTEGDSFGDLFFIHSVQAWYESDKVGVGGGFSGRFLATGDAQGFGERSLYQLGLFSNFTFGNFMPGFQVRIPLDDNLTRLDYGTTYSLSVGIKI